MGILGPACYNRNTRQRPEVHRLTSLRPGVTCSVARRPSHTHQSFDDDSNQATGRPAVGTSSTDTRTESAADGRTDAYASSDAHESLNMTFISTTEDSSSEGDSSRQVRQGDESQDLGKHFKGLGYADYQTAAAGAPIVPHDDEDVDRASAMGASVARAAGAPVTASSVEVAQDLHADEDLGEEDLDEDQGGAEGHEGMDDAAMVEGPSNMDVSNVSGPAAPVMEPRYVGTTHLLHLPLARELSEAVSGVCVVDCIYSILLPDECVEQKLSCLGWLSCSAVQTPVQPDRF